MKLSTKLLLSYFAVAFLVLLVGAGSFYLNKSIKDDLIGESRISLTEMELVSDLGFHLQNSLLYTRNFLIEKNREREAGPVEFQIKSRTAEETVRKHLEKFSERLSYLEENNRYPGTVTGDLQDNYNQLDQLTDSLRISFQLYQSLIREMFELEEEGTYGDEIFDMTIEPYFRTTLLPILENLRENQQERVELQLAAIQQEAEDTAYIIVFIAGIAFIIASWLAYFMYLSIARPLQHLSNATEEIGAGNLEKRINIGTDDELDRLGESFNKMAENLNNSMVSREYVNNIIQSMGDMLIVTDSDFNIMMVNKAITSILGYDSNELTGKKVWSLLDQQKIHELKYKLTSSENSKSVEGSFRAENGKHIPVIMSSSVMKNKDQETSGVVFVASNITTQKEAEEKINKSLKEKEVLLAEIHHRVKNNLAVISGLLEMQVWNLKDEDKSISALKESQLRIQSIALVHELLYQSETFSEIKLDEYVNKLLNAIEKAHKQSDKTIKLETDLEPVRLTIQKAIPASLLLNELVVNAFKHAFNGLHDGTISIKLSQDEENIYLKVSDNGVGLPEGFDPFKQKTLGMTLIKTLVHQIDADFEMDSKENSGSEFSVVFNEEEV